MGLLFAPEISRMVTAFQLETRLTLAPPVSLSLNFDNLYTTHDPAIMPSIFDPFTLTEEAQNTSKMLHTTTLWLNFVTTPMDLEPLYQYTPTPPSPQPNDREIVSLYSSPHRHIYSHQTLLFTPPFRDS